MAKETILVTGGAGFIGSCFVGQAIEAGHKVVVLDALTYAGHRENLDWIGAGEDRLVFVQGSICDGALVGNLLREHNIMWIADFAAESHVDNSIEKPSEFIETNVMGTYTMLEAARQFWNALPEQDKPHFRFLHVSTDEVYGSLGETGKFTELSRMKPNSPYSASKAAGDHLCRAWFKTYNLPVIVTNCTNNYGPRQFPEKLIPLMITNALNGKKLPIYGDGKNVRDWIHVEDHCRGIYLALDKGLPGETYCFGGDAEKNNVEVVDTICTILMEEVPKASGHYNDQIEYVKDRPGHDRRYAIDDTKAQETLGFTREHDFTSGIRATVKWYLENTGWCQSVMTKAA